LIGGTVIVKLTTALIARGQQIYNGNAWKHLCYNWPPRNALLLQCSMQKQLAICLIYHGVSSGIRTFEILDVLEAQYPLYDYVFQGFWLLMWWFSTLSGTYCNIWTSKHLTVKQFEYKCLSKNNDSI
jgi:hypothetical protein